MVHKEKSQGRLFLCEKVFYIKLKHVLKFQRYNIALFHA